jgi:hypothetical protein
MRVLLTTAVLLLGVQPQTDPLLQRLVGTWQGSGTVLGQASSIEVEWSRTLDGQFFRLSFRNDMGSGPGGRRFEGHAYYKPIGDGRYRGMWFDNSGAMRPIEARVDGDALVARWGTPDTEVGETTYRLQAGGALEVGDRVQQKDGSWRSFGQSVLMKR